MRFFLTQTLELLGRFGELQIVSRDLLRDAQARGDIYASVLARTSSPSLTWLAEDRPQLAEDNATQAIREWSSRGFHLEHVYGLFTLISARLYVGDAAGAHALASECVRRASGSLLWRSQILRGRLLYLRAASALFVVERGLGDRARSLRDLP